MNESFGRRWNWFAWLYRLAGNDIRLREAWLRAPVIELFNQMSFLTELDAENNRLNKK